MQKAQVLSINEFKCVLAVAQNGRNSARNVLMLAFSFYAGLRACEIAALKISDIYEANFDVKTVVNLSKSQTKGSTSRQFVISDKLKSILIKYAAQHALQPNAALIASQKQNKHFSANSLTQRFKQLYIKANLTNASSHSGRRTFITNLANKAINTKVIMELAGHKNLSTTQRYIDVQQVQLVTAVNLI